ncbi:unnamed protein product [Cochlearia groenlandica]
MDSETIKFGGPRELCGALDLVNRYKLLPHHDFFCNRSLPRSLSDARYLRNMVGETDIRKGEGMQLDQLITHPSLSRDTTTHARIQPFVLDELKAAFEIFDTAPVELLPAEKGAPTIASKSKSESRDRDRKHRKHKDKNKEKDGEHKKHKHKRKDRSKDEDRDRNKEKTGHRDKKRKHTVHEDPDGAQRRQRKHNKSSKLDDMAKL